MNTLLATAAPLSLADDRLKGLRAIGQFLGETEREAQYLVERRRIPFVREGRNIISFKSWLVKHYKQPLTPDTS